MTTYTLYSIPIPEAEVRAAPDGTIVIQADDQPVTRWRTQDAKPVPGVCCCGVRLRTWTPAGPCCCGVHR